MKKLGDKDIFFIGVLTLVIAVLMLGSGKGNGKNIPLDDRHRPLYDAFKSGRTRAATELICATCHGKSAIPLPNDHPPKEQCLICHLMVAG